MMRLLCTLFAALFALPVLGDGTQTLIQWPEWTVSSTEDIYNGRKHTSYPLTYLFDNNPSTAWVFSGTGKHLPHQETGYAITLTRKESISAEYVERRPVAMDSVYIMNGYNKSRELFFRNNRITQLTIYVNGEFVKTTTLKDSMGWHRISIPRKRVDEIKLKFTGFACGKDNDICVSELAFYDRGKKVDMKMPRAVIYTDGDGECGCGQEYHIVSRSGRRLIAEEDTPVYMWSKNGRYVAGVSQYSRETPMIWIIDAAAGRPIVKKRFGQTENDCISPDDIHWKSNHILAFRLRTYPPGVSDYRKAIGSRDLMIRVP